MLRTRCLILTLLAILWTIPPEIDAQSLAELARQERRRRIQRGTSGKIFTNEDLGQYGNGSSGAPSGRSATSPVTFKSSSSSFKPSVAAEERQWSQRFIEAKARVAAARQRQKALQSKVKDLNQKLQGNPFRQTTVVDPANAYGPLIARARQRIQQNDLALATAERELTDLREALRKSGKPRSWEHSRAALRPAASPSAGEKEQRPKAKDQAYWQRRLALIDQRYHSRIRPLEAERFPLVHRRTPQNEESLAIGGHRGLGLPPRVVDLDIQIKRLKRQQTQEKQAVMEQALRSGALPGWFR